MYEALCQDLCHALDHVGKQKDMFQPLSSLNPSGTDIHRYSNKRIVGCGNKQGEWEKKWGQNLYHRVNDNLSEEITCKWNF